MTQTGLIQLYDGSVITEPFDVRRYGAVGDGVTDDTAAINAAIAALNIVGGGVLFFPQGTYVVSAALTPITASASIVGVGGAFAASDHGVFSAGTGSCIQTAAAIHVMTLTGAFAVVRDLAFSFNSGSAAAAGTVALTLAAQGQQVSRCTFSKWYDAIVSTDDAWEWQVAHTNFFNAQHSEINISYGGANPDRGDMAVTACAFEQNTAAIGTSGILYAAHGGLRVTSCKFLQYAYAVLLNAADSTSDLLISNCSIENQDTAGLQLQSTGGIFHNVIVQGCEFGMLAGVPAVVVNGSGQKIQRVAVTGNVMVSGGGAAIGVDLQDVAYATIDANQLIAWATAGIKIAAAAVETTVGPSNLYTLTPTPIWDITTVGQASLEWVARTTKRTLPAITSTVAYTNIFQVVMDDTAFNGALILLVLEGVLQGVDVFSRTIRKLLTYGASGDVVVTDVDDVASATAINVQFDVTTTSGAVLIGLEKPAGGTAINGSATLIIEGHVNRVIIL